MKEESRWKPDGSGWRKRTFKNKPWKVQWVHLETAAVRRDYGKYVETDLRGRRSYSGIGGGKFYIDSEGEIAIYPRKAATLSASHGTGNRGSKIIKATGKRNPAEFDETVSWVHKIRGCFIIPPEGEAIHDSIPGLPLDSGSREAIELVNTFSAELYPILCAIVRGDHKTLDGITQAVRNHEEVVRQVPENLKEFEDMQDALKDAIREANGVPTRLDVQRAYSVIQRAYSVRVNRAVDDIDLKSRTDLRDRVRGMLGRMGFGWLPSPPGKPKKK